MKLNHIPTTHLYIQIYKFSIFKMMGSHNIGGTNNFMLT